MKTPARIVFAILSVLLLMTWGASAQTSAPAKDKPAAEKKPAAAAKKPAKFTGSAIQVKMVECDEVKLPADFQMALYENMIDQITKTGKFPHVYREGEDASKESNLVVLKTDVRGFKKGNEMARNVTTVGGWGSIKIRAQFLDKDGQALLDRDVDGKVRFFGDNLRATYNLSKNVAGLVRTSF